MFISAKIKNVDKEAEVSPYPQLAVYFLLLQIQWVNDQIVQMFHLTF